MSYATDHISVWEFTAAPEELRRLSINGGDEDWLALVPGPMAGLYMPWLDSLGCCCVDEHRFGDFVVYIGSHA